MQHHLRRELLKLASTYLVYVKRKLINKLKINAKSHLSNIPRGEIEEDYKDRSGTIHRWAQRCNVG